MKTFSVHMDITFSGDIEVTANTEEQARKIAKEITSHYTHNDINNFYLLDTEVVDVEEI